MIMTKNDVKNSFFAKMLRTIGPGTIVMFIGVACFASWQLLAPRKVQVERRVETSGSRSLVRMPPASRLLSWRKELDLNEKQVVELSKIAKEEKQSLAPLDLEIKEKMEAFDRWIKMQGSRSLAEVQSVSSPISKLSLKKRELTWIYVQRALKVLSPSQKRLVEKLQEREFSVAERAASK